MTTAPNPKVVRDYMTVQVAFFASQGLQMVMLPYLVAIELGLGPQHLGVAQALIALPLFLLMMPGGALADRADSRDIITVVHTSAALLPIALAMTILSGLFTYNLLIVFGVMMGVLGAFGQPARDSLLNRVVSSSNGAIGLQRAVGLATVIMFSSQIIGMLLASQADRLGAATIMATQGIVLALSVVFIRRLTLVKPELPDHPPGLAYQFGQMWDGFKEAFGHKHIMPICMISLFIGIYYMGAFNVILPMQIRDIFNGGSQEIAMMFIAFFGGTITSSTALLRRGGVERAGLTVLLAVSCGAIVLALVALPLSYWGVLACAFVWGMGAGVTITVSRGVVQELSPESHRGRLLAVFSMGFMGGAPVGNVMTGWLIDSPWFDARTVALVPSILMAVSLVVLALSTDLMKIRLPKHK